MATTTTNLGLTLPGTSDDIDITVLNGNFQKLDTSYPATKLVISTAAPQPLGTAAAGTTGQVSDAGHVHQNPHLESLGNFTGSPANGQIPQYNSSTSTWSAVNPPTNTGSSLVISTATPQPLGTAAAGSTGQVSDAGHVHAKTAASALSDTNITSPAASQILQYVSGKWTNVAIPADTDPFGNGLVVTLDPQNISQTAVTEYTNLSQGQCYVRVRGSGTITRVRVFSTTSGTNTFYAGVFRQSGTGSSGVPAGALVASGSVTFTGTGPVDIVLSQSTAINTGDWFYLSGGSMLTTSVGGYVVYPGISYNAGTTNQAAPSTAPALTSSNYSAGIPVALGL